MSFLNVIRDTLARYQMLRSGDCVGVAVSGGADSVCLLHVLIELQTELGVNLAVVHIDHNLRGAQSQEDAQFVHNLAQQLGLPFHTRTLDLCLGGGNLEQEARHARYQFFRELVRDGAVQKIATGHTRSDQAETVLFRLLRGAGSAGLAGIRPVTDQGVIRPLLRATRPQVEAWLTERGINWCEDATNSDLRFDRNRLRHQLIPLLEAHWNPGIQNILAQTADWAWEEEQYWHSQIQQLTTTMGASDALVRVRPAGRANSPAELIEALIIDVNRLNPLPVATVRRLIREIVRQLNCNSLGIDFAHIEAIRQMASGPKGHGRQQIAGLEVLRSFNWLRFAKREAASAGKHPDWQIPVTAPGRYTVPPRRGTAYVVPPITIELELISNEGVYNGSWNALDGDKVGAGVLRNWRAGDRYRRQGHAGVEKVKKLFEEHRVPLWDRHNWPIITVDGRIAWASGFGPAAEFAMNANSRKVLMIHTGPVTPEKV